MTKHLLVPIDFSDVCLKAIPVALEMALALKADVTLVHVVADKRPSIAPGRPSRPPPATMMSGVQQEEARLKEVRETMLSDLENVTLQLISTETDAAHAISEHAKDMDMDMIVMTTHGRSGLSHAIMGSVTESIIRTAPCPVLVVREESAPADA